MKHYNLDGIVTEMKKDLSEARTLLDLWKNVKIVTKKDGTPFKQMQKNFEGASYKRSELALQPGENELYVYGWDESKGYINDKIECYIQVKYLKDKTMIAKTENFMPKQSFLEQIYVFDVEDIREAIKKRIKYLETYTQELEEQIAAARKIYNDFKIAYDKTMKELEASCTKWEHKDLFYAIRDTVKDCYPYC